MERVTSSSVASFLFWAILVLKASADGDVDVLYTLRKKLIDPNKALQNWDATSLNPCTWFHIQCDGTSVIGVDLGNLSLFGQLVPELGQLSDLRQLDLNSNNLTGKIPEELGNLVYLESLNLSSNNLNGSIPNTLGKLQNLRFLRLNNNNLTGVIPMSLTGVHLEDLDLSNNRLEGDTPVNGSFSSFTPVSFLNNPRLKLPKTFSSRPLPPSSQASSGSERLLEWPLRKKIAVGAAKGLAYLHDHCDPKIIHRDVKAANILLDEEFEAVVGDFGLAKLMDYKDTHVTTAVKGTHGHIAPEYLLTGKSSEKTDVFGYGMMLLELITRRKAFDLARLAEKDDAMLLDWVKEHLKEKKLEKLVHADLQGNYDSEEVEQLIQVAILCTQGSPMERPKMSEVVRMLNGDGLAEKWEQWHNEETSRQEFNNNNTHQRNANWIVDSASHDIQSKGSTSIILPEELSGPR